MLGDNLAHEIKHARARQEEELAMAALAEQADQLRTEQEQLAVQAAEVARMLEQQVALPADSSQGAAGLCARPAARRARWRADRALGRR